MRRSSSEKIRNLQRRVAQLEGKTANRQIPETLKRDLQNLGSSCKVVEHSKGMVLTHERKYVHDGYTYNTTQMEGFIVKCRLNLLRKDVFVVFTRNLILDEYDMEVMGAMDDKLVGVYNTLAEANRNFK